LTKIENLDSLTLLDQLYLSENGLAEIAGLERNVEISTLDLANNKIRVIENIEHLSKLEEFWVRRPSVYVEQYHFISCMNWHTSRVRTSST
jgi:Leucine-rich repeat (LRR) protein